MKTRNGILISLTLLAVGAADAQTAPVTVSPAAVNLNYQIGGLNNQGAQQAVTLSTAADTALPYQFGTPTVGTNPQNCNWLSVNPAGGTIPAGGSAQSTIGYNCPPGLPAGNYAGSVPVAVTGSSLSTASIPVNLLVSNSPLLFVPTDTLNFVYELGMSPPAAQSVTPQSSAVAANAAGGQMPIAVSAATASGGSWLALAPSGALSTGSPISISVNPASLSPGTYTGTVTVAPTAGAAAGNSAQTIPVTLTVANGPSIQVSGNYGSYSGPIPPPTPVPLTALSFPYQIGQAVPLSQGVTVSSSTGEPLNYSVTSAEATCANVSWLTLGGNTSGVTGQAAGFTVAVQNLASLPVGVCTGTIAVNAIDPATGDPALGSPLSIPVTLYVSETPLLSVYAPFLGFTLPVGGSVATYSIGVNTTQLGVNLSFTVSETTSSGGNWLAASTDGSPGIASVTANPGALTVGTYNGTVTVTATGAGVADSPLTIPVTLHLEPEALVLSASSLGFTYIPGAPAPASQTVQVTTNVSAEFGFSVVANSGTAGGNWLSVTPTGGNAPGMLSIGVNGLGLAPGTYSGTVIVTAPNAGNSPAAIPVTLTVYAGSISASPSPALGLTFVSSGGNAPQAQTIAISKVPASLTLGAATSTASGGDWLSFQTISGATASAFQLEVLANAAGLAAGTYTGAVTIMAPGASGSPIIYPVTLIVTPALVVTASPAALSFGYTLNAPAPAAQTVQVSVQSTGAIEPLSFPATASATTASGGNWLSLTQFANGIAPGTISASVNPAGLAQGSYTGVIAISSPDGITPLALPVTLTVSAQATPAIAAVANAPSGFSGAVSPGEEVAIYGSSFGPSTLVTATPTGGAYPTTLANTQVLFDGVPAPIVAITVGQVDVMVPYSVSGKATTAVQIVYFGVTSAAGSYNVAAAVPGIYTLNQTGSGQAAILNQDLSVNGVNNPAAPGSVVAIYLTGEGITSPPSVAGQLAPTNGSGLNTPVLPVTAIVEGLPAQVRYAGSAPGLVYGVMQVNVQIPANAPAGNLFVVIAVGTTSTQTGVTVAVN